MISYAVRKLGVLACAASLLGLYAQSATAQVALDVICGKCVDTEDIADGAVGTKALADGAVTRPKIATDAVGTKALARGAVTRAKIAKGAVGTRAIATNAVTAAKISKNAVTGAKIAPGAVGSEAIAAGAVTAAELADDAVYVRTIVVSPLVDPLGTPVQNGNLLLDALAGVIGNNPSEDDRWLIKLEPGIFNIRSTALEMVRFVDIEGSGVGVTKILGDLDDVDTGVVDLSRDSELRYLTVEHTGDPDGSIAISYDSTGINIGRISHVEALAGGGTPSCALFVNGGVAMVQGSRLIGFVGGDSVCVDSGIANIAASQLIGPPSGVGANCVGGTYNDTFEMLIEDCVTLLSSYANP